MSSSALGWLCCLGCCFGCFVQLAVGVCGCMASRRVAWLLAGMKGWWTGTDWQVHHRWEGDVCARWLDVRQGSASGLCVCKYKYSHLQIQL
ncbi:hypothetical protein IWZ00DRAFT_514241 [Phyllosticta capitalensis]